MRTYPHKKTSSGELIQYPDTPKFSQTNYDTAIKICNAEIEKRVREIAELKWCIVRIEEDRYTNDDDTLSAYKCLQQFANIVSSTIEKE